MGWWTVDGRECHRLVLRGRRSVQREAQQPPREVPTVRSHLSAKTLLFCGRPQGPLRVWLVAAQWRCTACSIEARRHLIFDRSPSRLQHRPPGSDCSTRPRPNCEWRKHLPRAAQARNHPPYMIAVGWSMVDTGRHSRSNTKTAARRRRSLRWSPGGVMSALGGGVRPILVDENLTAKFEPHLELTRAASDCRTGLVQHDDPIERVHPIDRRRRRGVGHPE